MYKVILDTNFLIHCLDFHVDIPIELEKILGSSFEIYVLDGVLKELEGLGKKMVLKYVERFEILKGSGKYVDDELVGFSEKGYIVATQDKGLKKRLQKLFVVIRQKKYLQLER